MSETQQLNKEEGTLEQQERSPSMDQKDWDPPHIKEEELWISLDGEEADPTKFPFIPFPEKLQWGFGVDQRDTEPPHIKVEEQLQGLEDADTTHFPFTPVSLKSEDDEEKPQTSHLHQRQRGEEKRADGEAEKDSESDDVTEESSDSEAEACDDDQKDPDGKPFHCSVCGSGFSHRRSLNVHMRNHKRVKVFCCYICKKAFSQKSGRGKHMKTHAGEWPFECQYCSRTFHHKGSLRRHMMLHPGWKPYPCSSCGDKFRSKKQLKIHHCTWKTSHPTMKRETEECDAMFADNNLLVTHMKMHKSKKLFICTVCGHRSPSKTHLEVHMRTHTGEKPYSCPFCDKRFSQSGLMRQHMAVHLGEQPYRCSDCGRKFFWQYQMKNHKCSRTPFYRRFYDQSYKKSELANSNLDAEDPDNTDADFWKGTRKYHSGFTYQRHKKVSVNSGSNVREENFGGSSDMAKNELKKQNTVDIDLGNRFKQSNSGLKFLKREDSFTGNRTSSASVSASKNTDSLHTNKKCDKTEQPFSCPYCGEGFTTGGCFTKHIHVHTGEKPLRCVVCEEIFTKESELLSHVCVGESLEPYQSGTEGESPAKKSFKCSFCAEEFGCKDDLLVHMRVHTQEKLFNCSVCSQRFPKQEDLSFHSPCHTVEKPFCCSVCNKDITYDSLIEHMRIHSRQTQLSLSVCDMEVHRAEQIHRDCDETIFGSDGIEEHESGKAPSDPERHLQPETWEETKDSSEDKETEEHLPGFTSLKTAAIFNSHKDFFSPHRYPVLKIHRYIPTGEELLHGSDRGSLGPDVKADNGIRRRVKQENTEPPCIKEELEEVQISPPDATLNLVSVKTEDDEEKPQTSQPHQKHDEEMETVFGCKGLSESGSFSVSAHPEVKTEDSCDTDDSDFWKETRRPDPGSNSANKTSVCSDGKDSGSESDFWEERKKKLPSDSNSVKNDVSSSDEKSHTQKKTHSCATCGKSFDAVRYLNNHMRSHQERKAFICPVCGLKCLFKSRLRMHMLTHSGEKPFSCPVCGKRYAQKAGMNAHLETHSEEKKHRCDVCGLNFAWFTELKYHRCVRKSSGENPAWTKTMSPLSA
ncbi:zinc finger protein 182-like [Cheilinus undulatus]|uniref:zinc finger protein 182-like n=1 Tax=Cheilinus undulatus TaxID=241271 RepID=UPI001BD57629|nr:zinc finger protein 182-like [Cheilinus undulatus]